MGAGKADMKKFVILIRVLKLLEKENKLINRPTTVGGKKYDRYFIYVPTDVVKDSLFPFKLNDKVLVRIEPEKKELIIKKA